MDRPRLLLVPSFTELEWEPIRPRLEEWAEVASFDLPGVGDEPRAEKIDRGIVVDRGLEEIGRRGWERCFVATDGWGIPSVARLAIARPEAVLGIALGHARLSQLREGDRAPVNGAVWSAMTELIDTDHEAFIRYGVAQATGGSVSEEHAERMIERFPRDLLAVGCLMSPEEGFDDAAAAFPQARTVEVEDAPLSSEKFADAMREFCEDVFVAEGSA